MRHMTEQEWRALVEPEELREIAIRIGRRYMGDARAEEFGARNATAGELLVRLRPEHVLAQAELAD